MVSTKKPPVAERPGVGCGEAPRAGTHRAGENRQPSLAPFCGSNPPCSSNYGGTCPKINPDSDEAVPLDLRRVAGPPLSGASRPWQGLIWKVSYYDTKLCQIVSKCRLVQVVQPGPRGGPVRSLARAEVYDEIPPGPRFSTSSPYACVCAHTPVCNCGLQTQNYMRSYIACGKCARVYMNIYIIIGPTGPNTSKYPPELGLRGPNPAGPGWTRADLVQKLRISGIRLSRFRKAVAQISPSNLNRSLQTQNYFNSFDRRSCEFLSQI